MALQIASGAASAGCVLPYVRDILRGTTKPHRVSWFAFALLSTLAAAVQLSGGLAAGAWLSLGAAAGFTSVFLLSIKRGVGGTSARDRAQLVASAVAAAAWLMTDSTLVGVLLVCAIEFAAIVPTATKAYADPASETLATWVIDGFAGIVALASAVGAVELIYPVGHVVVNGTVVAAVTFGNRRSPKPLPLDHPH